MATSRLLPWLVCVTLVASCTKDRDTAAPAKPEGSSRANAPSEPIPRCAPGVKPLPARIERGVCLAHNYQRGGSRGYGSDTSRASLEELEALGVQWVSITPFGFMQRLDEPTVHPIGGYRAGETDDRVIREIRAAKSLGLNVLLKPHLWIVDGQWRGQIDFESEAEWQQWFDAYARWMLHYADLAESEDVETLVVGVELRTTEQRFEDRWRRLIRQIRKRFDGKLTYSANWDDAAQVPWWDALDFVGVQFYPPLAKTNDATRASIDRVLALRLDELGSLSARVDRPVLFTEVGFRSADDALVQPHAWPERAGRVTIDPKTQALGYACFIDSVRDRPWVAGIYWWKWFTDPNTSEEGPGGFSPRGKLAESYLRAAYGGECDTASATP
ncbi:MAG: hypothetical protein AAF997_16690 [Myxococcota bacterium]